MNLVSVTVVRTAVAVVVAMVSGYVAGRMEGAVDIRRVELHAARQIAAEAAQGAVVATERSLALDQAVQDTAQRSQQIKVLVRERMTQPQPAADHEAPICPPAAAAVLDAGTVGLLNAARADLPASAASAIGDEEGAPAAAASVADFIDNDLDVVRLYHELAKRHDELVDFVTDEMRKRAAP